MPNQIAIVAVGLAEDHRSTISPLLDERFTMHSISFFEPPAAQLGALMTADAAIVKWEKAGGKTTQLLGQLADAVMTKRPAIFLIYDEGEKPSLPDEKTLQKLRVDRTIELPSRYFEIQRLLYELTPEASKDDVDEEVERRSTFRRLKLQPIKGLTAVQAAAIVHRNSLDRLRRAALPSLSYLLYHPDRGFADKLCLQIKATAKVECEAVDNVDSAMACLRRGSSGLILWYDGEDKTSDLILEHFAESRRLGPIPILAMIPGHNAMRLLAENQRHNLYDSVLLFEHKMKDFKPAIDALKQARQDQESPRALLYRLRNDAQATPEQTAPLFQALSAKGKQYWSIWEETLSLLKQQNEQQTRDAVISLATMRRDAFATMLMQHFATAAIDRHQAGKELVEQTLAFPTLTADRLFHVGMVLERWRVASSLADLLDAWHEMPRFANDVQALYLGYCYHMIIGKHWCAGDYLASAVIRDPWRHEYLEAMASYLGEKNHRAESQSVSRLLKDLRVA